VSDIERVLDETYSSAPIANPPMCDGTESKREPRGSGDPSSLLDAVELFVRRFVVVDEAQASAITLWIAHTWAIEAAYATPYLFICSAEPESGKTRLLEVFQELVREPISTMNISDAALFRTIASKEPTVLFDEVDAIFNPKARERGHRDDLRALLNAGYRRGQLVHRIGGGNNTILEEFRVFGAKALAGLGDLPPTLQSRCVRLELKRRRLDEPVEDFFPEEIADEAQVLCDQLAAWVAVDLETLRTTRPVRIEGLRDRTNEGWRPLLAIAELAGEAWLARARRAALALAPQADEDASLGVLLLGDIRTVFDRREVERISTADLIAALGGFEESPWGEWWLDAKTDGMLRTAPRRLAQLLKPFGIRSRDVRTNGSKKGYKLEDFQDAWERFLPPSRPSATSATSATTGSHKQRDVADVADVADTREPPHGDALGGRDRFCEACTTPELCSEEHYCQELVLLDEEHDAGEAGRKEHDR
jgi:Protein of unknown function (DUF3631)